MSMEQSISELAAAIRELAAAARGGFASSMAITEQFDKVAARIGSDAVFVPVTEAHSEVKKGEMTGKPLKKDAELDQAVQKVEKAAAAQAAAVTQAKPLPQEVVEAASSIDTAPLDYIKDVRPVLMAAIKKSGKDAVLGMLNDDFGVGKGDAVPADKLGDLLAAAQKLAG